MKAAQHVEPKAANGQSEPVVVTARLHRCLRS
jgi:hypothetical protein